MHRCYPISCILCQAAPCTLVCLSIYVCVCGLIHVSNIPYSCVEKHHLPLLRHRFPRYLTNLSWGKIKDGRIWVRFWFSNDDADCGCCDSFWSTDNGSTDTSSCFHLSHLPCSFGRHLLVPFLCFQVMRS